jgi:endonuclease G
MARARIRLALNEAVRGYLFDPNVRMIDFGNPRRRGCLCEDEGAIRVHVRIKLSGAALESAVRAGDTTPIPKVIAGLQTDVTVGRYRPHFVFPGPSSRPAKASPYSRPARTTRATRADPMCGGISISDAAQYTYGTLGGLVFDRATGAPMILSNWHVLVGDWSQRPGLAIFQPGRLDGGMYTDTVARYLRDAMAANLDAAVATVGNMRHLINNQVDLGPVHGSTTAEIGMDVVKSGRASGVTYGRVTGIEGSQRMRYAGVERLIRKCVTIEPREDGAQVSTGGDSGSLWLDADSRRAVGLHFAGSDVPERALAIDLETVLDVLQVQLATV